MSMNTGEPDGCRFLTRNTDELELPFSFNWVNSWPLSEKNQIGALHLERSESKPKAWVRMNKGIEMNPKADSHPGTDEA